MVFRTTPKAGKVKGATTTARTTSTTKRWSVITVGNGELAQRKRFEGLADGQDLGGRGGKLGDLINARRRVENSGDICNSSIVTERFFDWCPAGHGHRVWLCSLVSANLLIAVDVLLLKSARYILGLTALVYKGDTSTALMPFLYTSMSVAKVGEWNRAW